MPIYCGAMAFMCWLSTTTALEKASPGPSTILRMSLRQDSICRVLRESSACCTRRLVRCRVVDLRHGATGSAIPGRDSGKHLPHLALLLASFLAAVRRTTRFSSRLSRARAQAAADFGSCATARRSQDSPDFRGAGRADTAIGWSPVPGNDAAVRPSRPLDCAWGQPQCRLRGRPGGIFEARAWLSRLSFAPARRVTWRRSTREHGHCSGAESHRRKPLLHLRGRQTPGIWTENSIASAAPAVHRCGERRG